MNERGLQQLKKQLDQVEKDKQRNYGKLDSGLKSLAALVGDDCRPDEAEEEAKILIAKLKKKEESAGQKLEGLYIEIDKQVKKLGIRL